MLRGFGSRPKGFPSFSTVYTLKVISFILISSMGQFIILKLNILKFSDFSDYHVGTLGHSVLHHSTHYGGLGQGIDWCFIHKRWYLSHPQHFGGYHVWTSEQSVLHHSTHDSGHGQRMDWWFIQQRWYLSYPQHFGGYHVWTPEQSVLHHSTHDSGHGQQMDWWPIWQRWNLSRPRSSEKLFVRIYKFFKKRNTIS